MWAGLGSRHSRVTVQCNAHFNAALVSGGLAFGIGGVFVMW